MPAIPEKLDAGQYGGQSFCMVLSRALLPVTDLDGDNLLDVWSQCVESHRKAGAHHHDIGCANLKYCRDGDGTLTGVVLDCDLASNFSATSAIPRAGTIPFRTKKRIRGNSCRVKPCCRQDQETFIWVFVWLTLQHENGTLRPPRSRILDGWMSGNLSGKTALLSRIFNNSRSIPVPDCNKWNWTYIRWRLFDLLPLACGVFDPSYYVCKPERTNNERAEELAERADAALQVNDF
ncbi:hypothetical protein F5I97DRAFT_1506175 [Phlebopus sp. FC_14]|nr:hypothetical protein F5I97DRAFT_1506175 [Phlebopus sp. FC_14]